MERWLAGEHLVENYSQTPDVGASIDMLAAGLFRRHIDCGSQQQTGLSVKRGSDAGVELRFVSAGGGGAGAR